MSHNNIHNQVLDIVSGEFQSSFSSQDVQQMQMSITALEDLVNQGGVGAPGC